MRNQTMLWYRLESATHVGGIKLSFRLRRHEVDGSLSPIPLPDFAEDPRPV